MFFLSALLQHHANSVGLQNQTNAYRRAHLRQLDNEIQETLYMRHKVPLCLIYCLVGVSGYDECQGRLYVTLTQKGGNLVELHTFQETF